MIRISPILLALACLWMGGCATSVPPRVQFTRIPLADQGGPNQTGTISGRVAAAQPGQRIVLYAKSGSWYVQPFADQPFTEIQPDSHWSSTTHLGTDYAALLVAANYVPPTQATELPVPGGAVLFVAVTEGRPPVWRTWWFRSALMLVLLLTTLAIYRWRMHELTQRLNVRFEERLAERTRIAQELHDTLLQGFLSASMQLHVAADQLPEDSPLRPQLSKVLDLMRRVIEEGRNAVRGLRPSPENIDSLEQAFSQIRQEFASAGTVDFRIVAEGPSLPLHPVIRDEVYRIGREALVNAFRHSKARTIELEMESGSHHLRVLIRDDGCGIDPKVLQTGRDGHWGLSGMRERAERIGGRLKIWSRMDDGTEVELSVPANIAFKAVPPARSAAKL